MDYRKLGRTGISVSSICLGTMTWGNQNSEAQAHQQMDYAVDHGINFFDTAELYAVPPSAETQGLTERYIGSWFKKTGKRNDIILASKIVGKGRPWIREGKPIDKHEVVTALDGNLSRLGVEHIDLYQLHWPNREHYNFERGFGFNPFGQNYQAIVDNLGETLEALDTQVKAGKIRHIGVSNDSSWGVMKMIAMAETLGLPRVASIQNEYSLIRRQFDLDLAEISAFEDVSLLAYSPLAAGLLSGKYNDGQMPEGSRGAIQGVWRQNANSEAATKKYMTLAKTHGLDVVQMALAYCLIKPFMTSVIIGATTMEQLKTNIGAADIVLSTAVIEGIEKIHRQFPRTI